MIMMIHPEETVIPTAVYIPGPRQTNLLQAVIHQIANQQNLIKESVHLVGIYQATQNIKPWWNFMAESVVNPE